MGWLTANWADLVQLALAILGAFSLVAKLTPTQTDDKFLAKLYSIVHFLGLTKK